MAIINIASPVNLLKNMFNITTKELSQTDILDYINHGEFYEFFIERVLLWH